MDLIAIVPLDYVVLAVADVEGHWLVWANCARVLRMVGSVPSCATLQLHLELVLNMLKTPVRSGVLIERM